MNIKEGGGIMKNREIMIYPQMSKKIFLQVVPGHFATNYSHINQYIDLTNIKTKINEATEAGKIMAMPYKTTVIVDTIICMDQTEVVGAFLAKELSAHQIKSMNAGQAIHIISPEYTSTGQILFSENVQPLIRGKQVLLLVATATTGGTITRTIDGISYYGGYVSGVSAIFSAQSEVQGHIVHSIFTSNDLNNYRSYPANDCPMCKNKQKLEAIVSGHGYKRL